MCYRGTESGSRVLRRGKVENEGVKGKEIEGEIRSRTVCE